MITFFTTTKSFTGKNYVNQINAITSWIKGNNYGCEVIVFGKSSGMDVLTTLPNIIIHEDIATNKNNVPYISSMFYKANNLAKNKIVCFLNADIIIGRKFINSILAIQKITQRNYLIVGQRIDTHFDYLVDFENAQWYNDLIKENESQMEIHPPYGSDFFAFPKGQYIPGSLPDLLVGRNGWDNYMFYDARRRRYKLINLSKQCKVIHQAHDYNHKSKDEIIQKIEEDHNYNFIHKYERNFYTLASCNYEFDNNKLKQNFKDWKFRLYKFRRFYFKLKNLMG